MRINWVIATGHQFDPTVDVETLKQIGPIWGSWATWRGCATDNVICHNTAKAKELIKRKFQDGCNFYIPEKHYQELNRPTPVKLYGGAFEEQVTHIDDIISLHLATETSDLVLLVGFNFSEIVNPGDRFELHKIKNYYGLIHSLVATSSVQFVLLDHAAELDKSYRDLTNLTCDTMENVLQLLAQ
jgi:hypothetical protein